MHKWGNTIQIVVYGGLIALGLFEKSIVTELAAIAGILLWNSPFRDR